MKRVLCLLTVCSVILLSACTAVSNKMYKEISRYVTENSATLIPEAENQFYEYKSTGISIGSTYYGYYYSAANEFLLPDFYCGNDLEQIKDDLHTNDGGVYFGKPRNGTDWCFIKKISDNWYYYELHWA